MRWRRDVEWRDGTGRPYSGIDGSSPPSPSTFCHADWGVIDRSRMPTVRRRCTKTGLYEASRSLTRYRGAWGHGETPALPPAAQHIRSAIDYGERGLTRGLQQYISERQCCRIPQPLDKWHFIADEK